MTARCPMPPALDELNAEELDQVIGKPLCCVACGGELELRCPEGHLHLVKHTPSPNNRPAPEHDATSTCPGCQKTYVPRKWQRRCDDCLSAPKPRSCPKCSSPMQPKAKVCRICNPEQQRGSNGARVYKPKACACGRTFTPTGPRAERCEVCRGSSSLIHRVEENG